MADILRWYAIHTNPKQENRADSNLIAWKVETFNPKLRTRRSNPYTDAPTYVTKPLFPRYIFARFKVNELLHKVYYTRGVHSVVCIGSNPSPVDDGIISILQSQVEKDGFIKMGEELKKGDKVVIQEGPFKSLVGIFDHKLKDSDRVSILLSCVSYQGRLVVEREQVKKSVNPTLLTGYGFSAPVVT